MPRRSTQSPETVYYAALPHKVAGKILVGETVDGRLCRVSFLSGKTIKSILDVWQKEWPKTFFKKNTKPKITKLTNKTPLHIVGTVFQQDVWLGLLTIKEGHTISYADLADIIKRPKAVRAVGTALGKNPLSITLPCHRVIAKNGGLGGFAGGLTLKKKLLRSENAKLLIPVE